MMGKMRGKPQKPQPRPVGFEEWPPEPLIISYERMREFSIFDRFPAHTQLLGVIAGLWGTLEFQMHGLFIRLLEPRTQEAVVIFNTLVSNKARRDVLRAVAATRLASNPPLLAKVNSAIEKIGKRANRRNDLMHGVWLYIHDADLLFRHATGPGKAKPRPLTDEIPEMKDFIAKLKATIDRTIDLQFEVDDFLKAEHAAHATQPVQPLARNPKPQSPRDRQKSPSTRQRQP